MLKSEIEKLQHSEDNNVDLQGKKCELENIRTEKQKGVIIRSRVQWLNEGEKPSKYFCSLEKQLYIEKTVKKIVTSSGNTITDQKEILKELKNYYENLFADRNIEITDQSFNKFAKTEGLVKLNDNEAKAMEGLLTIDEISKSLKSMKNQKSPGMDGFPAEFF